MGISITHSMPLAPDRAGRLPIQVELDCDDRSKMFCHGHKIFSDPNGYIGAHTLAMLAGWLERNGPQGRIWLCPECSGK